MHRAKGKIRELLRDSTDQTWTIRDIQESLSQWRGTIVHLAVLDMCRHGEVVLGDDLTVQVIGLKAD